MSDRTYKGVVKEVFEREWSDRDSGRDIILYSFQIETEKRYFRTGTKQPDFKAGAAISFVADGKSGNVDLKSVTAINDDEVTPPKSSGNSASRSSGTGSRTTATGSRDTYWADKAARDETITEPRISYSAAQKNATALVAAALHSDVLSFGQASKGKRLDMMVDFVEQTTLRLALLQINAPAILKEARDDS